MNSVLLIQVLHVMRRERVFVKLNQEIYLVVVLIIVIVVLGRNVVSLMDLVAVV